MTLRLRNDLFFPNSFLVDRLFDDDDLELVESLGDSYPKKKKAKRDHNQEAVNTIESLLSKSQLFSFCTLDLIESENNYIIHVDLPGVEPTDLDISVQDKYLVIKAERKSVQEQAENGKIHSVERVHGKTERKVRIPANSDLDNCQSKLKNGVLTITIPKQQKETVRKLVVQSE